MCHPLLCHLIKAFPTLKFLALCSPPVWMPHLICNLPGVLIEVVCPNYLSSNDH